MQQIKDQTAIAQALLQDSKRKASLEMDYRKKELLRATAFSREYCSYKVSQISCLYKQDHGPGSPDYWQ
jgi:hypothetical protein